MAKEDENENEVEGQIKAFSAIREIYRKGETFQLTEGYVLKKYILGYCASTWLAWHNSTASLQFTHKSEIKTTILEQNAITRTPIAHEERWANT